MSIRAPVAADDSSRAAAAREFVPLAAATTVALARRALAGAFRSAGLDSPEIDARLLVGHALGLDHAALAAAADRRLDDADRRAIADLAARRVAREPVARILGRWEFWSLDLELSADTLVPRPETECVVEAALAAMAVNGARERPLRLLDLGAGSGAILLALLRELPAATGVACDRSQAALLTARRNARRHDLAERAQFVCGDFSAAFAGGFDCVVSNPPYIVADAIDTLPPEVSVHDPRLALDGGADGLDAYRAIIGDARRLLAPAGALILELGMGQADAVSALCAASGLCVETPIRRDVAGMPRALTAWRRDGIEAVPRS